MEPTLQTPREDPRQMETNILLSSPQPSELLQQMLFAVGITDTGCGQHSPMACYLTHPRKEGSFWGQESN